MGGFLGLGGSAGKTDRGTQLSAQQADWNIFNQSMAMGNEGQETGKATLDTAKSDLQPAEEYYKSILQGGRQGVAQAAAPAVNAQIAQTDAMTSQMGQFGTGRSGGVVAHQQQAETAGQSKIDSIINDTIGGAAKGLTQTASAESGIGNMELFNSLSQLGLGKDAVNAILQNATESRKIDPNIGKSIGSLFGSWLIGGGGNPFSSGNNSSSGGYGSFDMGF